MNTLWLARNYILEQGHVVQLTDLVLAWLLYVCKLLPCIFIHSLAMNAAGTLVETQSVK